MKTRMVGTALVVTIVWCGSVVQAAVGLAHPEKSVALIRTVKQDFNYVTPWQRRGMSRTSGSGFIIEGNRILTNAHNVSNCRYIELRREDLARRFRTQVQFVGHDCDLAVLTVDDPSFFDGTTPLELAGIPSVNSTVSTYGFPVGGDRISVTEGVVSRIETDSYVHTGADRHLVIQTDAAINPGNSGGPVIQDGKVVGVAFQGLQEADNIGYLIPTTVIEHFLKDIEDGRYDGFGSMGVMLFQGLHNQSYRDYLKVPDDQDGIVVTGVMMHSSLESILQPNDVITRVGDYNVDNDGMAMFHGLRLSVTEVIQSKQIGETIDLVFCRDGKLMTAQATIAANEPVLQRSRQFDKPPRYVCFAGLVFVSATRNYLETWGSDWPRDIPFYLRYLFAHSEELNTDRDRTEYVVLSEVMPDEVNTYALKFRSRVVQSIGGVPIHGLADVREAFAKKTSGFFEIRFLGEDRALLIDAEAAHRRQSAILQKYRIPSGAFLEDEL